MVPSTCFRKLINPFGVQQQQMNFLYFKNEKIMGLKLRVEKKYYIRRNEISFSPELSIGFNFYYVVYDSQKKGLFSMCF
jgi:hypothetical protein